MLYFHFSFDGRCDHLSWNCCPPHGFSHCAISSTHGTQTKNLPTAMPLKGSKWSKGSRLSKVWPRPKSGAQSTLKELRWNHGIKWNDSNRKVGLSLGEVEESQYLSSSASSSLAPELHSFGMWIEVWVSTDACSLMSTLFHAEKVLHRWIICSRAAACKVHKFMASRQKHWAVSCSSWDTFGAIFLLLFCMETAWNGMSFVKQEATLPSMPGGASANMKYPHFGMQQCDVGCFQMFFR